VRGLYGFLVVCGLACMGYAFYAIYYVPETHAFACCEYGTDCSVGEQCCIPNSRQADCSKYSPNYCKNVPCDK
jgi:hypothetical protein